MRERVRQRLMAVHGRVSGDEMDQANEFNAAAGFDKRWNGATTCSSNRAKGIKEGSGCSRVALG